MNSMSLMELKYPEIKINALLNKIKESKRGVWVPVKTENWGEIQQQIKDYEDMIRETEEIEKLAEGNKDIQKRVALLEKAEKEYQKIGKIALQIQDKIAQKKKLESEIKFD